ncbi:hypothetical protein CJ207_11885, partial [Klebsiella aerogenes]
DIYRLDLLRLAAQHGTANATKQQHTSRRLSVPTGHRFRPTELHHFVTTLFTQLGSTPTEA